MGVKARTVVAVAVDDETSRSSSSSLVGCTRLIFTSSGGVIGEDCPSRASRPKNAIKKNTPQNAFRSAS
jgi:hypothetical protein